MGCGSRLPTDSTHLAHVVPAKTELSNVTRDDYVGTATCVGCHTDLAEPFTSSPMHRMTRDAATADVLAPFASAGEMEQVFRFGDETVRMLEQDGARFIVIATPGKMTATYRVTKLIGGHHREDYVGRRVISNFERLGDRAIALGPIEEQPDSHDTVMPVTWHYLHREWRYKGYSVQIPERPALSIGPRWDKTCIFCHNTVPYLATIYDDLGHYKKRVYQGTTPSNMLPEERRLSFRFDDPDRLASTLWRELALLEYAAMPPSSIEPRHLVGHALIATQQNFRESHLVELGIGCESCHNGGRAHAQDPAIKPSFIPQHPSFDVVRHDGSPMSEAQAENHACARCHSVLFSAYEHTWEGGRRDAEMPGGSTINSGEARDFLLGGCAEVMRCSTCHDPHAKDDKDHMRRLGTPQGNGVCTTCHSGYAAADALRKHAHHDPAGAGGSCIACHMPKKNIGLSYDLQRYHRIGSPTDPMRVERDRPLECALCHQDKSVDALVDTMERWWGKRYDRSALVALYGADLGVSTLEATVRRGLPHERTVAVKALGASGERRYAAVIASAFSDRLPITRYFARESLRELFGVLPDVDMSQPAERLRRDIEAWLETVESAPSPSP